MTNDKKNKIDSVGATSGTKVVDPTYAIKEVEQIKKTESVSSVASISGNREQRGATRVMTRKELDDLLKLVDQEADQVLGNSGLPKEQQIIARQAVKMALDASTIIEDEEDS